MRTFFLAVMIGSFLGLGVCDLVKSDWRTGMASVLLGIVQLLIFCKGQ